MAVETGCGANQIGGQKVAPSRGLLLEEDEAVAVHAVQCEQGAGGQRAPDEGSKKRSKV